MTPQWFNPIPQALQQHGGPPKRVADTAPATPLEAALEILSTLDRPGAFATSPAFEPGDFKTS
jgi:hypothetical protein